MCRLSRSARLNVRTAKKKLAQMPTNPTSDAAISATQRSDCPAPSPDTRPTSRTSSSPNVRKTEGTPIMRLYLTTGTSSVRHATHSAATSSARLLPFRTRSRVESESSPVASA